MLSLLLVSRPARATVDTVVAGTVHDVNLKPLAGATVVVHDPGGATVARAVTGPDGAFRFAGVPIGDYTVEASAPGLVSDHKHIRLTSAAAPEIDLILVDASAVITVREEVGAPPPSRATGTVASLNRETLKELPGAEDRPITDVVGTQAGFVVDALGNVYARGNHANIQYQIDGIPIPDSVGSLFAASIPVRLIQDVEIYTGGMPAEFGDRLGAVVNISTRHGAIHPDGSLQVRYGSGNTVEPGASYATTVGGVGVFAGGSFVFSERALDPPSIVPVLHDDGWSGRAFTRLDVPLGASDRVEIFATYARNRFEIPIDPTIALLDPSRPDLVRPVDAYGNASPPFVPHDTDATETEDEVFATASWVHSFAGGARLQIAPIYKLSRGVLIADAAHALGATADPGSTASDVTRTAHHLGGVAHLSIPVGDHLVKVGVQTDLLLGRTDFTLYTRDDASPAGGVASGQTGSGTDRTDALLSGAYVEDRWTLGDLILSGGLRVDEQHVFLPDGGDRDDVGVSPRLGASYRLVRDLVAHGFVGVNWQPPAPRCVSASSA